MWIIFKVFIEFVTILFLFLYFGFWPRGMPDLSSPTRDQTLTPGIGRRSLNHWTIREVHPLPTPAMHVYAYAPWAPPPHTHTHTHTWTITIPTGSIRIPTGPSQFPIHHIFVVDRCQRDYLTGFKFPSFLFYFLILWATLVA